MENCINFVHPRFKIVRSYCGGNVDMPSLGWKY